MKIKNLNRKFISLIFTTFLAYTTYSQVNYLNGYVVLLNGDTLHGFIDYRNWERNPKKISFKKKLDDDRVIYTPLNSKGFNVLDENYESGIINTEISSINTYNLDREAELKFETDTIFLQTMIQGKKGLYFYKNNLGKEQFYIRNDTTYELLVYKKYIKIQNGNAVIVENNKYLGQLMVYLNDCKTIKQKIENLKYQKNSMENLFLYYYKCSESKIEFQKETEKMLIETGLVAGVLISPEYNTSSLSDSDYIESSINMSVGLSIDFIFPRNQKKWSIHNELIYTLRNENRHTISYQNAYAHTIIDEESKYLMLKMNNMLRFQYPIAKIFTFFNFGISSGHGLNIILRCYEK